MLPCYERGAAQVPQPGVRRTLGKNQPAPGGSENGVIRIRFWQPSDLPYIQQMMVETTWSITPEDDKAHTTWATVADSASRNLEAILSSPGGTCIVADLNGRPVGFLLIGLQPNDKTGALHGYLADIYVEKPFRKSGVAREMHNLGEHYLRQMGIRYATNWIHAHNKGAQNASAQFGLKPWGVMMVKELQPAIQQRPVAAPVHAGAL